MNVVFVTVKRVLVSCLLCFSLITRTDSMKMASCTAIHWFRKGLRLHDNPALVAACRASAVVYPVFIIDPHFAGPEKVGINRYRFLLQSLHDLDTSLRALGSRLYLIRGRPEDKLKYFIQKWGVNLITFEADNEPYAKFRDESIMRLGEQLSVDVSVYESHNLQAMSQYSSIQGQQVTYGAFCKLFNSLSPPSVPLDVPSEVHISYRVYFISHCNVTINFSDCVALIEQAAPP